MLAFDRPLLKALVGEFLCTFIFVFTLSGTALSRPGLAGFALATALVSVAIIYSFGGLSGAHFNPAVTLAAMIGGKIHPIKGVMYMVLQVLAAISAVGTLMMLHPTDQVAESLVFKPGARASIPAAIVMEGVLTFVLVFVIYCTAMEVRTAAHSQDVESQDEDSEMVAANKQKLNFAPIAIGFTLGFLCFLGGAVSGGAFNPALATAPSVLALDFGNLWIYWVGDLVGAAVAAGLHMLLFAY